MKQYKVFYGSPPFENKTFTSWKEVCVFMKSLLDAGVIVRSVTKEEIYKEQIGVE